MRLIAWLIITVSLVACIVAAITAYSPPVTLPDELLASATLNAPAGRAGAQWPASTQPVAQKGEPLTPEVLARLRAAGESRVRLKEFSLRRWREWWVFAVGCAGMLAGGLWIRRENARQLVLDQRAADAGEGPDAAIKHLRAELDVLRRDVAGDTSGARLPLIRERVDHMTTHHIVPFIDARPVLVSRLKLAGYAQLMDRFAAGERQLNRAWSAAADGYEEEAVACLENAAVLFEEAEKRMK